MRYFKQGDHDGLCGFYAVLNAFRYLQHETGHQVLIDDDAAFFDEAVECLARLPGIDIRILKANSDVGGIDQYQIRDLCRLLAERIELDVSIELAGRKQAMPFRQRYRSLWKQGRSFAIIAAYRDGSHWIAATRGELNACCVIDAGHARLPSFVANDEPRLARDAAVILRELPG